MNTALRGPGLGLAVALLGSLVASPAGAQRRGADTEPPVIVHAPVASAAEGEDLELRARIEDPAGVFAPAVYFRARGGGEYDSVPMEADGDAFRAVIPASRVRGALEYFIEAFDELGNGPARKGRPEVPLPVEVSRRARPERPATPPIPLPGVVERPPPDHGDVVMARPLTGDEPAEEPGGVLGAWWFWALVVVGVAGGAAGLTLALGGRTPEFVNVEVRGPDPSTGL